MVARDRFKYQFKLSDFLLPKIQYELHVLCHNVQVREAEILKHLGFSGRKDKKHQVLTSLHE